MNTQVSMAAVCRSYAQVGDLRVFYRHSGAPSSPTIVLLHGTPASSHMFRDLIPMLAERFHVIAPDMIGFGYSDAPSVEEFKYTFANLAAVTENLVGRLGLGRYYLYLHGDGGTVGLRLAAKHPERVLGLIVQNANAYTEGERQTVVDIVVPLWLRGEETNARKMLQPQATKFTFTEVARNPAILNPDSWTLHQALLARPGAVDRQMALFYDYQNNVSNYKAWQAYMRAHQPKTLVTWGKGDPLFSDAGAQAYKRDLQDCEVHLFDGGHFALEESASEIAALIHQFFSVER